MKISVLVTRIFTFLPALAAFGAPAPAGAEPAKPNIIFLFSDDHRWDCVGIAGNDAIKTPNLDKMARDGQWYREAVIQIPICTASRAAILTGIPPSENGYYSNGSQRKDVLDAHGFDQYQVLPEQMKKAGYHTAFAGKWHLIPDPWLVGFETVKRWMLPGAGPYRNPKLAEGKTRETSRVQGFTQTLFADDALEVISARAEGKTTRPLFLWLAFTAPHSKFIPNPEPFSGMYDGMSAKDLAPDTFYDDPSKTRGGAAAWQKYYEAISALDAEVGRIMDKVQNSSLSTNTLVVFLGDNGFMMGRRGKWGKSLPYDDALRVPMIVWGSDNLMKARGTTVTAAANSIDLPPTFVKLAGATPPAEWAGRDLSPVIRDGKAHDITWSVSQFPENQAAKGTAAYRTIRTATHKLILWHPDSAKKPELYDLVKDPAENINLYGDPKVAEVQKRLETQLAEYRKSTGDDQWDLKGEVASFRKAANYSGEKPEPKRARKKGRAKRKNN